MHYPQRRGCLSQSLFPYGKWWQCFLNSMSSKAICVTLFPLNPLYGHPQASLAPLLCRWRSVQEAALPSEGAPLRELFCPPLPSLGNEERTTGRAGQGRVVPFAGVGQRPGSTSLKDVLRQVSDRIGENHSVQGWEIFLLFRQVRAEWGHPLSPLDRSWPQIQGNEYGDTLEKADS